MKKSWGVQRKSGSQEKQHQQSMFQGNEQTPVPDRTGEK